MKQFLKYFSVMIMVLVLSTGCGKDKDAKTILEEASANMKNVESMSMKMTLEMGIDVEGSTFSMNMLADMDMDKNENMHGTYTVSMMGISEDIEMYMTTKDGYEYTYMKPASSDEWQYTKEEAVVLPEEEDTELTEEMNEMFESMTDIKEVESDREGYTKLEVTVDMGKFNDLMAEYETGEELPAFDSETAMKMNLYIKDNYICIMEIDFTDLMKDMVEQDQEEYGSVTYSTVKMTIELGDFNKIDEIVVPEEVVNSAKVAIGEE